MLEGNYVGRRNKKGVQTFNPQYTKPSSSTLFTLAGVFGGPHGFFVISQLFDAVDYSNYVFWGFWNYNSVIQPLLASNILCLFISTEVTGGTELLHTHSSLIQHLNNVIFWELSAGHFSNLQRSEHKNNKNNNIPHL